LEKISVRIFRLPHDTIFAPKSEAVTARAHPDVTMRNQCCSQARIQGGAATIKVAAGSAVKGPSQLRERFRPTPDG
jgi:hypothetical protein